MPKFRNSSGFTLIELLIAVSIITVAFGVIISSSGAIQRNGRDAQRQSDLRNIQSILQQYYADQGSFPSGCCNSPLKLDSLTPSTQLTSSMGTPNPPATIKTYTTKLPIDPTQGQTYCYKAYSSLSAANTDPTASNCDNASINKCQYYLLCAKLENPGTPVSSVCETACGAGFNLEITTLK